MAHGIVYTYHPRYWKKVPKPKKVPTPPPVETEGLEVNHDQSSPSTPHGQVIYLYNVNLLITLARGLEIAGPPAPHEGGVWGFAPGGAGGTLCTLVSYSGCSGAPPSDGAGGGSVPS